MAVIIIEEVNLLDENFRWSGLLFKLSSLLSSLLVEWVESSLILACSLLLWVFSRDRCLIVTEEAVRWFNLGGKTDDVVGLGVVGLTWGESGGAGRGVWFGDFDWLKGKVK